MMTRITNLYFLLRLVSQTFLCEYDRTKCQLQTWVNKFVLYENVITQTTHYFDHQGNNWIQGPDLMQRRRSHAAGVVTDEVTTEKFVIVTGGDYHGISLDSTEMLINNQWNQGKMLIIIEFVCKFLCIKYMGK